MPDKITARPKRKPIAGGRAAADVLASINRSGATKKAFYNKAFGGVRLHLILIETFETKHTKKRQKISIVYK
jgi:hypothetical protein